LSQKIISDNLKKTEDKERLIRLKKEEIKRTKAEILNEKKEKYFAENSKIIPLSIKIPAGLIIWFLSIYGVDYFFPELAKHIPAAIPAVITGFLIIGGLFYYAEKTKNAVRKSHVNIVTSPSFSYPFSVSGNSFTDADSYEYVSKGLKTKGIICFVHNRILGIFSHAHLSRMNELFILYLLSEQVIRKKRKPGNMRSFTIVNSEEDE
jgi:hypothetical protein